MEQGQPKRERLKEHFYTFLVVAGVAGFATWAIVMNFKETFDRQNNTFTDSGRIEKVREVKQYGHGWSEETDYYVTINGHEYLLDHSLYQQDFAFVGQELDYTHYDGVIEGVVIVRED